MRYWIGVASKDHVSRGKAQPLKRMAVGDGLIYYSPKACFEGNTPLQAFLILAHMHGNARPRDQLAPTAPSLAKDAD